MLLHWIWKLEPSILHSMIDGPFPHFTENIHFLLCHSNIIVLLNLLQVVYAMPIAYSAKAIASFPLSTKSWSFQKLWWSKHSWCWSPWRFMPASKRLAGAGCCVGAWGIFKLVFFFFFLNWRFQNYFSIFGSEKIWKWLELSISEYNFREIIKFWNREDGFTNFNLFYTYVWFLSCYILLAQFSINNWILNRGNIFQFQPPLPYELNIRIEQSVTLLVRLFLNRHFQNLTDWRNI